MSDYDFDTLNKLIEEQELIGNVNGYETPLKRGSVVLAIIGGVLSSIAIASLWAIITVNTERQWVIMGIIAGLIVGYCVHLMARGKSLVISIIGAFFALFSCILGDYLTNVGFIAQHEGVEYFQALSMVDNTYFFEIAFLDFDFFSLIVYGIAAYEGFLICNNGEK